MICVAAQAGQRIAMQHYLSICAIFRDEAPYLEEWLRVHGGVGVDHFYLYDNGSRDDFRPILQPWLDKGAATLIDWPHEQGQLSAYADCLARRRRESRWIAFIDIDEFLFAPDGSDLPAILADFEAFPGVGANWVVFGSGGHLHKPAGLVTRSYERRASFDLRVGFERLLRPGGHPRNMADYPLFWAHVKSIVDPREVIRVHTPHSFQYRNAREAVDENGVPIRGGLLSSISAGVSVNRLRVNHYWSKSLRELESKVLRGAATKSAYYTPEFALRLERSLNAVVDRTIRPVVNRIYADRTYGGPAPSWRKIADASQT
jgi:hypothetical protein